MLKLPIKNSWGALLIIIRLSIGLVLQKIIALKYGAVGTTLLSHFQNLITLFTQPLQDIVGQGYVNGLRKTEYKKGEITAAAIFFSIIILLFTGTMLLIFQEKTFNQLAFLSQYTLLFSLSILLLAIQLILLNYLVAKAKIKVLFLLTLFPGIFILLIIYYATNTVESTLITYLALQAATVFIYLGYVFTNHSEIFKTPYKLNKKVSQHFINFVAIGITIWLCSKLTDFFVRSFAISHFNEQDTGHWQAVARISEAYKGVFISFLMISLFPLLSGLKLGRKLSATFINHLKKYGMVILGSSLGYLILKEEILILLFNKNYEITDALYNWHIAGDLLALLSFPFSILMLSQLKTRHYIWAEIIGTIAYLAAIFLLPNEKYSVLFYAYFFRYTIYLTLVIVLTRRYWSIA